GLPSPGVFRLPHAASRGRIASRQSQRAVAGGFPKTQGISRSPARTGRHRRANEPLRIVVHGTSLVSFGFSSDRSGRSKTVLCRRLGLLPGPHVELGDHSQSERQPTGRPSHKEAERITQEHLSAPLRPGVSVGGGLAGNGGQGAPKGVTLLSGGPPP